MTEARHLSMPGFKLKINEQYPNPTNQAKSEEYYMIYQSEFIGECKGCKLLVIIFSD